MVETNRPLTKDDIIRKGHIEAITIKGLPKDLELVAIGNLRQALQGLLDELEQEKKSSIGREDGLNIPPDMRLGNLGGGFLGYLHTVYKIKEWLGALLEK